jgi:hypothetical protein
MPGELKKKLIALSKDKNFTESLVKKVLPNIVVKVNGQSVY